MNAALLDSSTRTYRQFKALNESIKALQYLNDPHHKDDETYGVAEADVVKSYWDMTLLDKIHAAFGVFDTFELYTGEPRTHSVGEERRRVPGWP